MFDWEDLRHFSVFAQRGSLSAAARTLAVDHVTVARRIAALEAQLGLELVERKPRAYILTGDGEHVARLADRMLTESLAIERVSRAGGINLAGEIVVYAPAALSAVLIAPRLARLREAHPDLILRLDAASGEADLVVQWGRPVGGAKGGRKLGALRFGLFATPGYLNVREDADFKFIDDEAEQDVSPEADWLKVQAGRRAVVFRSGDLLVRRAAALAGVGVAALPEALSGGLARAPDDGLLLEREIWLILAEDVQDAAAIRAVGDFLESCFTSSALAMAALS
ncbi:LysR family transcriptional regulator [Caulobacter sp.]|jgi:DNA-binding transcriptional LysR family regulator|uniref:LysR family transcriptional regulator n=1 Tax=Caulobacter sp. TaxID=78 RepID=UPI00161D68D0